MKITQPGARVTIYLKDAPKEIVKDVHAPFTIFGLLQHEHKKSVLNFTVQRNTEYDGSVRSKVSLQEFIISSDAALICRS